MSQSIRPAAGFRWIKVSVLALAAFQVLALFIMKIDGHDAVHHLRWLAEFGRLAQAGIIWPRWLPGGYYGIGSPTFYFYPPATYLLGSLLYLMTPNASPVILLRIVAAIGYLASYFSMRLFLRSKDLDKDMVFYGSLLFAFAPYRYLTLFIRTSLSEHMGYAIIPLLFYGLDRLFVARRNDWKTIAAITGSITAAFYTNVPIAIILLLSAGIYVAWSILANGWKDSMLIVWCVALGLLTSAALLIPANAMQSYVHIGGLWRPDAAHSDHSPLMELINNGYTQVRLFMPAIFLSVLAMWIYWYRYGRKDVTPAVSPGAAAVWTVLLVLQLPYIAGPLYLYVLPFQLIQIPWRTNGVMMLLFAVSVIQFRSTRFFVPTIVTALATVVVLSGFGTMFMRSAPRDMHDLGTDPPEYMSAGLSNPDSVVRALRQSQGDPDIIFQSSQNSFREVHSTPYYRAYQLAIVSQDTATLRISDWPQWKLALNSRADPRGHDITGRIRVVLQPSDTLLQLHLATSKAETTGNWISLVGLVLFVSTLIVAQYRSRSN